MKNISETKAIILDLDGTLYFQKPLQLCMALLLLISCILPNGVRNMKIILKYRKLYENHIVDKERYSRLSEKYNITSKEIQSIVHSWLIKKPLFFIKLFRDRRLLSDMIRVQQSGIKLIVLSDYPTKEKLNAINFIPDFSYSSGELGVLKPNPLGLKQILTKHNLISSNCLLIGDRKDKDGALAEKLGMNYILLPGSFIIRHIKYKQIILCITKILN